MLIFTSEAFKNMPRLLLILAFTYIGREIKLKILSGSHAAYVYYYFNKIF